MKEPNLPIEANEEMGQSQMWYNFRLQVFVTLYRMPDDFSDYLRGGVERNLYNAYVKMGDTPIDAYVKVAEMTIREGE